MDGLACVCSGDSVASDKVMGYIWYDLVVHVHDAVLL